MFVEGLFNDTFVHLPADDCSWCTDNKSWTGSLRQACLNLEYHPDTASMAYTVVHIFVGSSLIATALTMMLVATLDRSGITDQTAKVMKKNLDKKKLKKQRELRILRWKKSKSSSALNALTNMVSH